MMDVYLSNETGFTKAIFSTREFRLLEEKEAHTPFPLTTDLLLINPFDCMHACLLLK